MADNAKKYISVSLTLGIIAASSALLIAGTFLIADPIIQQNTVKKIANNIGKIYKDETHTVFGYEEEKYQPEGENKSTVSVIYYIYDRTNKSEEEENKINDFMGVAFRTDGSNSYGKISLIIGFNLNGERVGIKEVTNEQSFASTLKKKYIDLVNKGERKVDDVSCGATYGATTVKSMINDAEDLAASKIAEHIAAKGGNNG